MKKKPIIQAVRGMRTMDGAGVRLTRILSQQETKTFDPFLMLDSFDSTDPNDYLAGFPMHPHRGIETVTYLIEGRIEHEDSLGNKGEIIAGESQWMSAGSGILHQEMPKACERMLGFQLWLNLPADEKMSEPSYLSITKAMIPVVQEGEATVRVISGTFGNAKGVTPRHIAARILDIALPAGGGITVPFTPGETGFLFFIMGDGRVGDVHVSEKAAVLLGDGDGISMVAGEGGARVIAYSGRALHEPIAWGGPIVMNTQRELALAFDELRRGTFIKHG